LVSSKDLGWFRVHSAQMQRIVKKALLRKVFLGGPSDKKKKGEVVPQNSRSVKT